MPVALVAGEFGLGDPGAETTLEAVLEALPSGWTGRAATRDVAGTRRRHGCEAVYADRPAALAKAVSGADAVVFAGGPISGVGPPRRAPRSGDGIQRALAPALVARARGKPFSWVGMGVGDIAGSRGRVAARALVRAADLLILRDEATARALAEAGAPHPFWVGVDPAWALLDEPVPAGPRTGICVVVDHALSERVGVEPLVAALQPFAGEDIPVTLQPWHAADGSSNGAAAAAALATRLPRARIAEPPSDLRAARRELASFRVVVGQHPHALSAAASARTPWVGIASSDELAELADRLSQPAVPPRAKPADLTVAISRAWQGPPAPGDLVHARVETADAMFRMLRLVLEQGNGEDPADAGRLRLAPGVGP